MKKNPRTTNKDGIMPARRRFIARARGRMAALFILLTAVALVVSNHSSATSGGAARATASVDSDSFTAVTGAAVLNKGEAERERERERERAEAKRASKRVRTGAASKSSDRRARSSKSRDVKGGKSAARAGRPGAKARAQEVSALAPSIKQHKNELGQTVYEIGTSGFDVSPPLTELAVPANEEVIMNDKPELPFPSWRVPRSNKRDTVVQAAPTRNSRFANVPSLAAPTTGFNFAGIIGTGSFPPDNNGSVGNDQFVETVNTRYQVWSLDRNTNTPTSLLGPSNINTLWAGFGGACQTRNDGDPVVLFDKVAGRWVITQFTSGARSE